MTKLNVETNDVQGERPITDEHVQNGKSLRNMLGERGIQPKNLPAAEDISTVERRLAKEEKQIAASGLGEISGS
ncbi:hypothetical protein JOF42_000408 [Microbacterium phyllosphaerae]|uniref:Uncharacterized protein n=1 Tax=Microbacterium phyllosphaerae TaxID=124798 RepID=A0ABS4WLT9_9MICO|nr:hypothetical protein [Microbacterium phyllosphaerae]MBP2376913.1 hypothetical protein [Microbacterium phyllosphaerae]